MPWTLTSFAPMPAALCLQEEHVAIVAVVFHSASGTTEELANSVMSGAHSLQGIDTLKVEIFSEQTIPGSLRCSHMQNNSQHFDGCILFLTKTYPELFKSSRHS